MVASGRMKSKKHLHVMIDEDLYRLLIEIAPGVYGQSRYRGAISYIVEEALRRYLSPLQHTASTQRNPKPTIRQAYGQVVEKIKEIEHLSFKPMEVSEKILDQAISEVRGSDPRTVRKWKDLFQRSGLIKFIGGYPPNRIVELL